MSYHKIFRDYSLTEPFFVVWNDENKVRIPSSVQQILYELCLNVNLDKPKDLERYCYFFFWDFKNKRRITPYLRERDDEKEEKSESSAFLGRRRSICNEPFNPEIDDDEDEHVVYPKSNEIKESLKLSLMHVFLFKHLENNDLEDLVDAMFEVHVKENEIIIREGDEGDYFYLVENGTYTAYKEENGEVKKLSIYYDNGCFGELALLYNAPRAASVIANTDGQLWALDRKTFRRIVLKGAFKKRKNYTESLSKVPILSTLEQGHLMNIADAVLEIAQNDGMWIFHEGDAADGMYFVLSGSVSIIKKDHHENLVEVKRLTVGDYFGELALITKRARAASVRAVGRVKLAFLNAGAFSRLIPKNLIDEMKRKFRLYEEELTNLLGRPTSVTY